MKTKVLMVCLGNICRSPLAEGILSSKTNPETVLVASAGTAGYHVGNSPDPRSIAVAANYGLDISTQRCQKLRADHLDDFDVIYAMDKSNYNNIISLAKNDLQRAKVHLLLNDSFAKNEVPDPYYGGEDGFDNVYQMINKACDQIAQKLTQK